MSNSHMAKQRLSNDLKKLQKLQEQEGIDAAPIKEDNIFQWEATIEGPLGTPWEGGIFMLKITFSDKYPTQPPKVVFLTKMYHPNIYNDGRICLDILDKAWKPVYDVWAILTSIRSLLCDPNCSSPANNDAANLFRQNRAEYQKKIRQLVEKSLQQ